MILNKSGFICKCGGKIDSRIVSGGETEDLNNGRQEKWVDVKFWCVSCGENETWSVEYKKGEMGRKGRFIWKKWDYSIFEN